MAAERAFAFPGVGVRFCGLEAAFAERHPATVLRRLEDASAGAGSDLAAALGDGHTDGLSEIDAQRFTFAFSCGVAEAAAGSGPPGVVVGYSLGLYAAVVASGALSFTDGLACVDAAWGCMRAVCSEPCGLGVVVGLERADVAAHLERGVAIVNQNHDLSIVVAGPEAALERTLQRALDDGAMKALKLRASLPFHHGTLLAEAVPRFAACLERLEWSVPRCPVLSCVDQTMIVTPGALRAYVAANLATPIHWQRTVSALAEAGVQEVVECGAGVSLTQNARMVDGAPRFRTLRTLTGGQG